MSKSRLPVILTVTLAAAVVLSGGLIASNMGFKLTRTLLAGSDPGSASGTQTLSLPYIRQVGIDTAWDLFRDIGTANVQNIQSYLTSNDTFLAYAFGSPNFPLVTGQGVFVKMGTTHNYVIVGSHDPAAVIQLEAGGATSASGTNLFSPPYHATAKTAYKLFIEIGPTRVQNIQRYDTATDSFQVYSFGLSNYLIVPGEAYFVKMGTTVAYSPSHY